MLQYFLRRLMLVIPVLLGATFIVFSMVRLTPGDPATAIAGEHASQELVELIRQQLGLDRPMVPQFVTYLGDLARGDMGNSLSTRRPVTVEISSRLPVTLRLTVLSLTLATLAGILVGVVSATRRYSVWDNLSMLLTLIGVSMPVFWLGLILLYVFSAKLQWLPASGSSTWQHMIMPAVTLAAASTAIIARMTRSSLLEVLRRDYITTARSKGLKERAVIYRHALKNALIPVVTVVGLQFGTLLGGAVLTETVFSISGIGRLLVGSIQRRDYPVVQGVVLVVAVGFVLINLVVDLLYAYLDPRIRYV